MKNHWTYLKDILISDIDNHEKLLQCYGYIRELDDEVVKKLSDYCELSIEQSELTREVSISTCIYLLLRAREELVDTAVPKFFVEFDRRVTDCRSLWKDVSE